VGGSPVHNTCTGTYSAEVTGTTDHQSRPPLPTRIKPLASLKQGSKSTLVSTTDSRETHVGKPSGIAGMGPVDREREAKLDEHAEPFRGFIDLRRTQTDSWRTDKVRHRLS
jgi:hypothetical protein